MMWIFFIDWQQYWKCDWTMNIGANRNAHGKRTVSTKQPQVKKWKTWQLGFQTLERYWASFQVTRLFHSAITRTKRFFFFFFEGGGGVCVLSSNAFTIWCCILISRPPRVIRRFKHCSCFHCTVVCGGGSPEALTFSSTGPCTWLLFSALRTVRLT